MALVVLIVHLLVCICLIGLVLLQRSEGGALGMGGGGGGALMSGRGAADALARMTMVAGGFFLVTSFGLTLLSGAASTPQSIFNAPATPSAPLTTPSAIAPATTTTPAPADTAPAQPTTAPDPTTQGNATQAAPNRLAAAFSPGPASAAASTPSSTRAAPLTAHPPATTVATNNRPPAGTATSVPASVNSNAAVTRPPVATTTRSGNGTTGGATTTAANRPLVLPNTSGSVGGIALTDDPPIHAESSEGGVQAVRRERAGPDQ